MPIDPASFTTEWSSLNSSNNLFYNYLNFSFSLVGPEKHNLILQPHESWNIATKYASETKSKQKQNKLQ